MSLSTENVERIKKVFQHRPKHHWGTDLHRCIDGDLVMCEVKIRSFSLFAKGTKILAQTCDTRQYVSMIFFHKKTGYLRKLFSVGQRKIIAGKINISRNYFQIIHPTCHNTQDMMKIDKISYEDGTDINELKKNIEKIIEPKEWLNSNTIHDLALPSFLDALRDHYTNNNAREESLLRLAYDEIFAFQLSLSHKERKPRSIFHPKNDWAEKLIAKLSFKLTGDQQKTLKEISDDQESQWQMIRLIQGEVGSGKTILAVLTILRAVENGAQTALLAPTGTLAKQHMLYIKNLLQQADMTHISCGYIAAELSGKEKRLVIEKMQRGWTQIVVGTHALLYEKVSFQKLGLIVIDEQQRFGVLQRLRLAEKGNDPDILLLTATPIPRTAMLMRYGQISCSRLQEKPQERLKIITTMKPISYYSKLRQRLHASINKYKIFWLCPLIENSECFDLANIKSRFDNLQAEFGAKVGMIHGRLSETEIAEEIAKFRDGRRRLLVCTSIIEVGIHVPDASLIIIENAERFGLSSLHQLRGRVGRSSLQSYCLLLHALSLSESGRKRLQTICNSGDGFHIAEQDLKIRGAGEIFGEIQSGLTPFLFFDPSKHQNLLKNAVQEVKKTNISILSRDFLLAIFDFQHKFRE